MKLGIMQPYFFPYIGYFQLINAVDQFVVYDNIKFSKKGWIQRNRILQNGKDEYISLPLKKDSDYLDVRERYLADDFEMYRVKLLSKIKNNYHKAPYFAEVYPLIERIFKNTEINLFLFVFSSIKQVCDYLGIDTPLTVSSTIAIDHQLKSEEKVKAIVGKMGASVYINSIGGQSLYDKADFAKAGIELMFMRTNLISYAQFSNAFVPNLSIIDVMMFNDKEKIKGMLEEYQLVS